MREALLKEMFQNLLIADSGQGHVEEMIGMLRNLPGFRDARLNLLYVVKAKSTSSASDIENAWEEGAATLAGALKRMRLNPNDVNTIIRQGDAKQTVLKVADELNADLIVMGSRGLGRLQSILSNSTSQYVFQLSERPMLLVRDDLYIRYIKSLLVTIDGTGVGDDALRHACEIVRQIPGGQLTGIHLTRQDLTPTRGGRSKPDQILDAAVKRARGMGVEMKPMHRTSPNIGVGVCDAAVETKADLVLIGSQDRRPMFARSLVDLEKLLGSSTSDYIRVHAQAPVLIAKEPEKSRR